VTAGVPGRRRRDVGCYIVATLVAVATGALVAGYVLLVVRAIRSRSEADVRLAAGGAVALLLAGTVFLATYAVIMENYQVDPTGVPMAWAIAGACLLGAAFSAGCLYTGRLAWWRPLGPKGLGLRSPAPRDGPKVARVSALANGSLLLNGQKSDIRKIEVEFKRLKHAAGVVWYHRESGQGEPPPSAMAVIELVVQYGLPVSMSSKPDFSDVIDRDGRSRPRPSGS
jgi:hypothetical protein